jgi:hypothetical protein
MAGIVAVAVSASVGGYLLNRVVGRNTPNIGNPGAEEPQKSPAKDSGSEPKPPPNDSPSHEPPAVNHEPIPNSQPNSSKPADDAPAGTKLLEVGARVRVTKYTGAYTDERTARMSAMVDAGQKGEILKAPRDSSVCHVRFGPPLGRDYWIHRDALEVE